MSIRKIALVNQRYGLEVNGGSEYYTRLLAEMLNAEYDVEVLTTTALDYITWENHYNQGLQEIEGIRVRRFSVDSNRKLFRFRILSKILQYIKLPILERLWLDSQGPLSTELIKFIKNNKDNYDIFIFVTYLYYHTVAGLPEVSNKALLIPTAHNEPYVYYKMYRRIFNIPKAIVYLTEEEKNFVHTTFKNETIIHDVIGIGISVPDYINPDFFRSKYNISGDYFIYVGRIDTEKGCQVLFDYFTNFIKKNMNTSVKLILVGKPMMELPKNPNIISVGFISEEDKFNAIVGSLALILPSEYESLSISVLEAMALSVPVIVNGKCAVLKGHCDKSKAGLYFNDYTEFETDLKIMLQKNSNEYQILKRNAADYIEHNYTWEACKKKFYRILNKI